MFFANFWAWLNGILSGYVGTTTATVAAAVEPAVVTLATIYVMLWGYASVTGKIQEPVLEFVKRIVIIAVILGVAINLWYFNSVIVDTFVNAPGQLAATVVGAASPITTIDQIWNDGGAAADQLWKKGGVFTGDVGFYIASALVYGLVGGLCVYAFFLMSLASIMLSVILALGPIFIGMLFFDATKRFFESWIAQLANYALIAVLVALVSALFLSLVQTFTAQIEALGSSITFFATLEMLLSVGLVLLVLRQVPSVAAGLASGIALSSFGAVSSALRMAGRGARLFGSTMYQGGRGFADGLAGNESSRWDSLRRKGGNYLGSKARGLKGSSSRGGTISRDRAMPRNTPR